MTPEQEEQVRRALAALGEPPVADAPAQDASPAAPLPPEVAARLDDTLAGLVAERATETAGSAAGTGTAAEAETPGSTAGTTDTGAEPAAAEPVTATAKGQRSAQVAARDELAARRRRRRRRRPGVLLAAAAVAAVAAVGAGIATGRFATSSSENSTSAGSASSDEGTASGGSATSGRAPAAGRADVSPRSVQGSPSGPPPSASSSSAPARPGLHRATLRRDVERLLVTHPVSSDALWARACRRPDATAGERLLGVRLDGRRATLLLGPVAEGRRTARVYSCAGAPMASATVRAGS